MTKSKAKKWLDKYPPISMEFEVLFLHYEFSRATLKGWTLKAVAKVLGINFTKNMPISMKGSPISYPGIFLKYYLLDETIPLLSQT